MSGAMIDIKVEDRKVIAAFEKLSRLMGNTTPVMRAIGTGLVGSTQRRFVAQTSPQGAPWAALHPSYRSLKRNSRILTESGNLRGSISEQAGQDYVRVGTNKIYAAIHQFGGTIKPKASRRLFFQLATGFVGAKSVTIPARPYLGISDDDEKMISETVFYFLQKHQ